MLSHALRFPLHSMFIHPLKSGTPQSVETLNVFLDGIELDRRLMVVDGNYRFLTAREMPELLAVRCVVIEGGYVFFAPGMSPIEIGRTAIEGADATVWQDTVKAGSFGRNIDDWLSSYLKRQARLVSMTEETRRPLRMTPGRSYTFADTGPVLLTSQASLDELNERLDTPITMQQFRPNIVVRTTIAWEEDHWDRIRIGEVEFDVGTACDRCAMITIDPATRLRSPIAEPLKTLTTYRKVENNHVYFGLYLVPRNTGRVFLSDELEVTKYKAKPHFVNVVPPAPRLIRTDLLESHGISTEPARVKKLALQCVAVLDEPSDVKTFRFRTEPAQPMRYFAGQFINTEIPHPDGKTVRSYSLSSSPSRPHDLSISVKRVEGGAVSNWLHDNLGVGMRLNASGPVGHFHFLKRPGRKVLLLGAGSGMTPMISMLRWIVDQHVPTDVILHQTARSRSGLLFADEMAVLARVASIPVRISCNLTKDRECDPALQGRLDDEVLARICPDVDERIVFCCGPDPYRSAIRALLGRRKNFNTVNFLEESFGGAAPAENAAAGARADLAADANISIGFPGADRSVTARTTDTLLTIIRAAGLEIASGCQAGLCGACKCKVVSGEWTLSPSNVDPDMSCLPDDEKAAGYVLACSCCPAGDMQIVLA
ncbi:MOSC domain-containing protein [Rhizobium leguminosarum]|nr:MOSC domain-containing protein [Rhizobium ruizarguesonis]NEI97913.1 MOSC domain-containing protein [Rhizobium ruizarguesonis]NEJ34452.1 MOSC domain-containing protein [Rhizobium ruizarguesonis]